MTAAARSRASSAASSPTSPLQNLVVVLPQGRPGRPDGPGGGGQLRGDVLHGELAEVGVRDRDDGVPRREVGVGEHVAGPEDAPGGHPGLVQAAEQVVGAERGGPGRDEGVQLGHGGPAGRVRGEPGVGGQVRAIHDRREPGEDGVLIRRDQHQVPVAGRVHVAGRHVGQHRARPLPLVARDRPLRQQRLHHGQDRLVDSRIHHLAAAGALPVMQGHQGAQAGEGGRERVAERDAGPDRRLLRGSHHVPDPAHRLADRAEPGPGGVGPGLAVAGHPGDDQARVLLPERLGRQPPAFQRARPEVLHQDVGAGEQPAQQLLAVGGAQVAGDRHLVPGHDRPPQRLAVRFLPPPLTHRVALARQLDLDHLGPEIAEQLAAERPGQQLAQLDHPQVAQGQFRLAHRSSSGSLSMVARALYRWLRMTASAQSASPARAAATISRWWARLRARAPGL